MNQKALKKLLMKTALMITKANLELFNKTDREYYLEICIGNLYGVYNVAQMSNLQDREIQNEIEELLKAIYEIKRKILFKEPIIISELEIKIINRSEFYEI